MVQAKLLDCRPASHFLLAHVPGSVNLPLEELPRRVHELPAPGASLTIVDSDRQRCSEAVRFLQSRGLVTWTRLLGQEELTQAGPSHAYLWSPTSLLAETLARHAVPRGPALDLGCGTGRDSAYLATQGFEVLAVDILPDALERAADLANRCSVSLQTRQLDLRSQWTFPEAHYALVAMFRFLHRPILPRLPQLLRPGGLLVLETFHERSRDTASGPRKESHLLKTGELAQTFAGLELLHLQDGLERSGRFFSQLIARKRA